jgi:4-amino-4-deoxy-L-arabinose transferase-like glycosyltransferase
MYRSFQLHPVTTADQYRMVARLGGCVAFVAWLVLVVQEAIMQGPPVAITQGAAIAFVFAGYAIGWRNELVGGLLSIIATIAYYVVCAVGINTLPQLATILFAVPGLFYLAAWWQDRPFSNQNS